MTNIPDLKITVGDSGAIAELLISLDGNNWQNVKSQLVNNAVTIDRPKLEALFGKSLEDGSYTVSVRSKDNVEKVMNQSLSFEIDTLAPMLEVTGIEDGMTWDSTTKFAGSLRDRDSLTNMEYWVNDNGVKRSIALNAANTAGSRLFNDVALSNSPDRF